MHQPGVNGSWEKEFRVARVCRVKKADAQPYVSKDSKRTRLCKDCTQDIYPKLVPWHTRVVDLDC